jgi:heterodisulfide reductase subunit A
MNYASPNVVSSMEMERIISAGLKRPSDQKTPEHIVFVLCSGSRANEKKGGGVPYCSKTCCAITVKQANRVISDKTKVSVICYNDVRAYERAFGKFYINARSAKNVSFINGQVRQVEDQNGKLRIYVETPVGDKELWAELVVLAEALLPKVDLIEKLGLKTDKHNFPIEVQPRIIRPTESLVDRVYVVGALTGPKIVQESVGQGSVAALKALYHLSKEKKEALKYVSMVDRERCSSCRICEVVCPHGAIKVAEEAVVDQAFCQGCGLCMASCPSHAIQLVNFTDKQILDQVEVAFSGVKEEPKILTLLCYWCSYAAADLMGLKGLKLPANFRSIRIRCSSSIHSGLILEIFRRGVDGILIAGCPPKNCHHLWGNYMAANRVELMNMLMNQIGLSPSRLRWEYVGVAMWSALAKAIKEMDKALRKLGPKMHRG